MKLDTEKVTDSLQWWIQEKDKWRYCPGFTRWGDANPKSRCANLLFWPIVPQKMHKKNGPRRVGSCVPAASWIRQCKFVKGKFPW